MKNFRDIERQHRLSVAAVGYATARMTALRSLPGFFARPWASELINTNRIALVGL
jgi:hypothetical protein